MTVRTLSPHGPAVGQQPPLLLSGDAVDLGRVSRISWSQLLAQGALVVGRDPVQLAWVQAALMAIGMGPVFTATEVASAILALRRKAIGLIITAADLCGTDGGLHLIRWLRRSGPTASRTIPAVVLTPGCDPAWITRAGENGMSLVLHYPLNMGDFQARIAALIESDSLPHRHLPTDGAGLPDES